MAPKVDVNALRQMDHLPSTEDMKAQVEQTVAPEKPPVPENDPRHQKEYTFEFKWTDGRGKVWQGTFRNRILSMRERSMAGIMRARLAGGQPYESLDILTREINLMVAHMTFSLAEDDRPEWAKDLNAIDDVRLLQALYDEVLKHENTFFGW